MANISLTIDTSAIVERMQQWDKVKPGTALCDAMEQAVRMKRFWTKVCKAKLIDGAIVFAPTELFERLDKAIWDGDTDAVLKLVEEMTE